MLKKLSLIVLLIIFICLTLTSCYDAREIDDEVYAIAIGIDKGKTNKVKLTIQYPTYKSEEKSGGGGKPEESKSKNDQAGSNVHVIECPSVLEGFNMLSMAISRRVSLMHVKVLIFSEELGREGVHDYIAPMERNHEMRSSMQVIVTRGTAEDFIKENITNIGGSISKAIELLISQSTYGNYFPQVKFLDFYKALLSPYEQPIAIYGGVNDFKKISQTDSEPSLVVGKGDLPGELIREGIVKRELCGAAVFRDDKMVGFLDTYEFTYFQMIRGKFTNGYVTIEDEKAPGHAIVVNFKNSRKPIVKAYLRDGNPVIDTTVKLEGDVEAIQSRINYEKLGQIEDLNKQLKDFILAGMKRTVEKTQKDLKSDVFGFGRWVAGQFSTIQEWEQYNWLKHYPQAEINIDLDVNIRRTGTMVRSTKIWDDENTNQTKEQ